MLFLLASFILHHGFVYVPILCLIWRGSLNLESYEIKSVFNKHITYAFCCFFLSTLT